MPTFQFEAMDATGQEIKDLIERRAKKKRKPRFGRWDTSSRRSRSRSPARRPPKRRKAARRKAFAIGGVKSKVLTTFTRQLSILQDAGLPILRSLRILEGQQKAGRLKNSLIDVCEDIESGSTLSEAMGKQHQGLRPAVREHDQGRRGGRCAGSDSAPPGRVPGKVRVAEAQGQRRDGLPGRRYLRGGRHLGFIMYKIVPSFVKIFDDFDAEAAGDDRAVDEHSSYATVHFWYLIPAHSHQLLADREADAQIPPRPHRLGPCSCSRCRSSVRSSRRTSSPARRARWARWWPAACPFSKP